MIHTPDEDKVGHSSRLGHHDRVTVLGASIGSVVGMAATVQSHRGPGTGRRPSYCRRWRQSAPSSSLRLVQAKRVVTEACLLVQIWQALLLCPTGAEIWGAVIWRSGVVVMHVASGFLVAVIWRAGSWAESFSWLGAVTVCGVGSEALRVGVQDSDFVRVQRRARVVSLSTA